MNRLAIAPRDWNLRKQAITISIAWLAALAATSSTAQQWLEFDGAAIANGQPWRILTGHLVHWNTDHFVWDVIMFAVLGVVCERANRRSYVSCVVGSMIVISAAILWLLPDTKFYRGLSGVDSALFILASVHWLREAWRNHDLALLVPAIMALLGFAAKLVYEVTTGATLFVDSAGAGFVPLPLVHAVGALVGFSAAFLRTPERIEMAEAAGLTGQTRPSV